MIRQTDIIGIVACGGSSSRMGTDKGLLAYYGKPQRYYLYEMLLPFCKEVFISCTAEQSNSIEKSYAFITDAHQYAGHGPVSGLLSCFSSNPNRALLFAGCDYPNINEAEVERLLNKREMNFSATAFRNKLTGKPEPLFTIYEPASLDIIHKRFKENKFSLREFLEHSKANLIDPLSNDLLKSINTREAYESVIKNQC